MDGFEVDPGLAVDAEGVRLAARDPDGLVEGQPALPEELLAAAPGLYSQSKVLVFQNWFIQRTSERRATLTVPGTGKPSKPSGTAST
ncbi:hypothetical protein [Arthrobacter sp. HMWF013]|uniref:hypothetical protein n=1 Tax=Arthrobacter sp. HMWF013 TaxID=2056849 RepID=UPI000D376E2C|nr:hypothetical protein [Arthrobacter sp. HMWF013]PTT67007.1 hypothetical protein DBR22_09850 [Arthrobacter sp. HMWF013]